MQRPHTARERGCMFVYGWVGVSLFLSLSLSLSLCTIRRHSSPGISPLVGQPREPQSPERTHVTLGEQCRGASPRRNSALLGPCSRNMPRSLWCPWGGSFYERGTPVGCIPQPAPQLVALLVSKKLPLWYHVAPVIAPIVPGHHS